MRQAALATEAVLSPAVGAVIGLVLDRKKGWEPWGMLAGFVLGGWVSFTILRRVIREMDRNDD